MSPFYQLLYGLQAIHLQNQASARAWIDAFLFRVSAMLPPNKRMVFNMERTVPATTISPMMAADLSELVDYTVVVASPGTAGLKHP